MWSCEMAYVLGYFAADGSMVRNNRGAHFIEFMSTDLTLIKQVRRALQSTHKLSKKASKKVEWKTQYRIQIGSKELFEDLSKLGFTQKKSQTLMFPKVPKVFAAHFVRGYFDGDGNVYFKKHFRKDRQVDTWVFTSGFTSGSYAFLHNLHQTLKKFGVQKGSIRTKYRNSGFELVLSRKDSVALFDFMYDNASARLQLPRKRKVFEHAIRTLRMRE